MKFFELVENATIPDARIAKRMGYSAGHYRDVRDGRAKRTATFERAAKNALIKIGIRKPDGTEYTESELFELETAIV